jgi:AraC-like DNA-binding protein/ligand-binding sensor protein
MGLDMDSSPADAAQALALVTGVDCTYMTIASELDDTDGRGERRSGEAKRRCSVCDAFLAGSPAPAVLEGSHRLALYQAERLGTSTIYLCSYGLLHLVAPIIRDAQATGALCVGPMALGSADSGVPATLRDSGPGRLMPEAALDAWLRHLPEQSPSEATALAEIVLRVAASLSDAGASEYLRPRADPDPAPPNDIQRYAFHLRSMEGDNRSSMRYPVELEQELLGLVSAGDRQGADRVLRSLLETVLSPGAGEQDEIRSRALELVVLLSRAAIVGGADVEEVFGLEYRYLLQVRRLQSTQEIGAWLTRILRRFMDLVFDLRHLRYTGHLSRVLRYIYAEFRNPVTLEHTASAVGLSPGYLSRIFNGELHCSFSDYVNAVRIREARRLLERSRTSIGDIAFQCGFRDHSYFTQVFRKHVGMAPSAYREQRR